MKRTLSVLIAALFLFSASAAYAGDCGELVQGMGSKLWRGSVNTVTGWVEIPVQVHKGYQKCSFLGGFWGIFKGVWCAAGRTISGAGEVATFWSADPESNEGIGVPLDSEYAWQNCGAPEEAECDFEKAVFYPMRDKFLRGVGYSLFGVAEVPGQIGKGIKCPSWDLGLIKGIWYFVGREAEGALDLTTFWLPNPCDTKAVKYDEKWPWSALGDELQVKG